jgi:hypothetical protein
MDNLVKKIVREMLEDMIKAPCFILEEIIDSVPPRWKVDHENKSIKIKPSCFDLLTLLVEDYYWFKGYSITEDPYLKS